MFPCRLGASLALAGLSFHHVQATSSSGLVVDADIAARPEPDHNNTSPRILHLRPRSYARDVHQTVDDAMPNLSWYPGTHAISVHTTNSYQCGASEPEAHVIKLSDGTYDRCATVWTPHERARHRFMRTTGDTSGTATRPLPLVFWFHPAGHNASYCQNSAFPLARMAVEIGSFALVCAEALQDIFGERGQWHLPEITTDSTGNRCSENDSLDVVYMNALIKELAGDALYDTTQLYFAGCSMGSQFSLFYATCRKIGYPDHVSAFATHCSGLKVKGDGIPFPRDNYQQGYSWGECPQCQYHPIAPMAFNDDVGLKACVFENSADEPNFKASSKRLVREWRKKGNRAEEHVQAGGHCDVSNFRPILQCMDDGYGRLLPKQELATLNNASTSPIADVLDDHVPFSADVVAEETGKEIESEASDTQPAPEQEVQPQTAATQEEVQALAAEDEGKEDEALQTMEDSTASETEGQSEDSDDNAAVPVKQSKAHKGQSEDSDDNAAAPVKQSKAHKGQSEDSDDNAAVPVKQSKAHKGLSEESDDNPAVVPAKQSKAHKDTADGAAHGKKGKGRSKKENLAAAAAADEAEATATVGDIDADVEGAIPSVSFRSTALHLVAAALLQAAFVALPHTV